MRNMIVLLALIGLLAACEELSGANGGESQMSSEAVTPDAADGHDQTQDQDQDQDTSQGGKG